MKTFSVLCFFLAGCLQVSDIDSEIEDSESSEDYSNYSDLERGSPDKEVGCPAYYQKVVLEGRAFFLEIPSECHLNYIETGRPVEDIDPLQEIVSEIHYSY